MDVVENLRKVINQNTVVMSFLGRAKRFVFHSKTFFSATVDYQFGIRADTLDL